MTTRKRAVIFLVLSTSAAILAPPPLTAGGWAVATVTADSLPEGIAAGEEFAISFVMRQHGVHPANWGTVPLAFTHTESQHRVNVVAEPDPATLKYTVRVTLPEAGLWRWTAGEGLVQPMGTLAVETQAETHQGRELFLSKGCVVCHSHSAVAAIRAETLGELATFNSGPDLSGYPVVREYLRLWLADPQAVRPDAQMPDLELNEVEIEALIEFLHTE